MKKLSRLLIAIAAILTRLARGVSMGKRTRGRTKGEAIYGTTDQLYTRKTAVVATAKRQPEGGFAAFNTINSCIERPLRQRANRSIALLIKTL